MLRNRIIPILLLHNNGLYKTQNFNLKSATYIGDPVNAIKIFNEKEVDELVILDVDCSKKNTSPNLELIQKMVSECFMPISYGGGVKSVQQAKNIINLGVEKIVLNSALITNPDIIYELSSSFGSQSIVASIDVKKSFFGGYNVFDSSQNRTTKIDILNHIENLQFKGVGEILITSVDTEGTLKGYDWGLMQHLKGKIKVPYVINGGASKIEDFRRGYLEYNCNSFAASSFFLFKGPLKGILITYPRYSDVFL